MDGALVGARSLNLNLTYWLISIFTKGLRLPLHYSEAPWECLKPSKHIPMSSHGNSKIIYVWALVVKCNVKWQKTLLMYLKIYWSRPIIALWAHGLMDFASSPPQIGGLGMKCIRSWNIIQSASNAHFSSIHISLIP
jgi:hypothetical protein